jgi:hypothetical protein
MKTSIHFLHFPEGSPAEMGQPPVTQRFTTSRHKSFPPKKSKREAPLPGPSSPAAHLTSHLACISLPSLGSPASPLPPPASGCSRTAARTSLISRREVPREIPKSNCNNDLPRKWGRFDSHKKSEKGSATWPPGTDSLLPRQSATFYHSPAHSGVPHAARINSPFDDGRASIGEVNSCRSLFESSSQFSPSPS